MRGNKNGARLAGDEYQHLYSWWLALGMEMPGSEIDKIIVENVKAVFTDDVTVHYKPNSNLSDCFYQIKYHVDPRSAYTSDSYLETKKEGKSLLQKIWKSWRELRHREKPCELYLVSTWAWKANDPLCHHINGYTDTINIETFMSDTRIRPRWQEHLGATDEELQDFVSCLRFYLGHNNSVLTQQVIERMKILHLQYDQGGLNAASKIVNEWVINNTCEINRERLQAAIKKHDLYRPPEKCVTIALSTIKPYDDATCDYTCDWCDEFEDIGPYRGHQLNDPTRWPVLLQDLYALKKEVDPYHYNVIKVRGSSRLPACFAFGFAFSHVAGYTLEVDSKTAGLWRTNATATDKFRLRVHTPSQGEIVDAEGDTVAIGISISGSSEIAVRRWLTQKNEKISAVHFVSSPTEANTTSLSNAGDAVAMAEEVKTIMRSFAQYWQARKLLLFYQGPAAGAYFIGHKLNAVCPQVQIMQDRGSGSNYIPSFLLR